MSKADSISKPKQAKSSSSRSDLRVSAYLIYNDGTLSTFDVLNDKAIALWNVVAGGGDAVKPSDSTKVKVSGSIDSLEIKIKGGRELLIDSIIMHADRDVDYVIENTGCTEIYVTISKSRRILYNDTIPFHCGE